MAEPTGVGKIATVLGTLENTLDLIDTKSPLSLFEDFANSMEEENHTNKHKRNKRNKVSTANEVSKKIKVSFDQTSERYLHTPNKNKIKDSFKIDDNEDTTEKQLKAKSPESQDNYIEENNKDKSLTAYKTVSCDDCGISFKSFTTLKNHQLKYQCGLNAETLMGNIETSTNMCGLCGVSARNMQQKLNHQCQVQPIMKCDVCHYSTKITNNMVLHKSFQHFAPLKCSLCDYEYKNYTLKQNPKQSARLALSNHMEIKHSTETHECFDCGEKFATKQKIEYHIKTKHVQYQCEYCNKKESSAYKLKQHKMIIHEQIQMTCSLCDFKAQSKHMISKHHKQTHT